MKALSPRKWKKSSSKDKKRALSNIGSESTRDIRGYISTKQKRKDVFIQKRPSLRELSGQSHKTKTVKKDSPKAPEVSKLSLHHITSETDSKPRDIIKRHFENSTEYTDGEDWCSSESTSDFLHLKEKLERRKTRPASIVKQDLVKDLGRIPVNWVPNPPSDTESTESLFTPKFKKPTPKSEKGLASFLNISTLNMPQTNKKNMQMSIWKIPTEELHRVTLEDFTSYSYVIIHGHQAPYTYVQTVKVVSNH